MAIKHAYSKYKYVWDHTEHERVPRERSDNAIVSYMSAARDIDDDMIKVMTTMLD